MTDQQKKAIEYFNKIGATKIEFKPEIKVNAGQDSWPLYIDDMEKRNENYLVTISNRNNEKYKKAVGTLEENFINALVIRLHQLSK